MLINMCHYCVLCAIISTQELLIHQVELIWVPGNQGVEDNENADECAIIRSSLNRTMMCNDVPTPFFIVVNKINDCALKLQRDDMQSTKRLWPLRS